MASRGVLKKKQNKRVLSAKSIALLLICDSIITEVKIDFLLITSIFFDSQITSCEIPF